MPDHAALVPIYHRYAKALPRVQDRVLKALGDAASKELLDEAAAQLGLLEDGQLLISDSYELTAVADHAFYDLRRDGKDAIERYLEAHDPPEDPVEAALLAALTRTRWALLFVHTIEPGVGLGTTDILGGPTTFVVSPDFADLLDDGVLIATRLATLPELTMPTSGAFPLDQVAEQEIYAELEECFPGRPLSTLADLSPEETVDFNRIVANAALEAMDWFRTTLVEDLPEEAFDPDATIQRATPRPGPASSPSGGRPPRGERPKPPKKRGKKGKRR